MAAKKKTAAVAEAAAEPVAEEMPKVVSVVVVKQYRDKETKVIHRAGEKLAMTEARLEEILQKGAFVKKV